MVQEQLYDYSPAPLSGAGLTFSRDDFSGP